MIKKMLGVFTSVVAALAVVGVAWAGTDDGTSASVTAAGETSTSVSIDDSSSSTDATIASSTDATVGSSTDATVASSTRATVDSSTSTSVDDSSTSTSTSIAASTSTSADSNSTTTSTTVGSTTSTSVDDNDRNVVPDGVTVHTIPGVGSVTIEAALGQLILVDVSAPGWNVEFDKVESDRIELEFTSAADAEAEFEARIDDGRVEVRIELD